MNKFVRPLIVLLVIVLVGAGGYLLWRRTAVEERIAVEDVLPVGPLAVLHLRDVEDHLAALGRTRLWQGLSGIDVMGGLAKIGVPEAQASNLEETWKEVFSPQNVAMLRRFFGREAAVAVYPVDFDGGEEDLARRLAGGVTLVLRLRPELRFIDALTALFQRLDKKVEISSRRRGDFKIHTLRTRDGSWELSYVQVGDLLVCGVGDRAVGRVLDVREGKTPPLRSEIDPNVGEGPSFVEGSIALERIGQALEGQFRKTLKALGASGDQEEAAARFEKALGRMAGLKSFHFAFEPGTPWRLRTALFFDKDRLAEDIAPFYDDPPVENSSLAMIPGGVLQYQWNGSLDVEDYWNEFKKEWRRGASDRGGAGSPEQEIRKLEQRLGLSIEGDLLPVIGDEFGGFLADVDLKGPFPVPRLALFLEVRDGAKASEILRKLIGQRPALRPQEEDYHGVTVTSFPIPLAPGLAPAYALVEDFLVFAVDGDLIKAMVDARGRSEAALAADLRGIDPGILEKNNSIVLFRLRRLMEKGEALIDWGQALQEKMKGQQQVVLKGMQERLEDVRSQMKARQSEIETLEEQLRGLKEVGGELPAEGNGDLAQRRKDLEAKIAEARKALEDRRQAEKELVEMIGRVERVAAGDDSKRKALIEDLVKPLMRSLASVRLIAGRAWLGDGVLRGVTSLDVE